MTTPTKPTINQILINCHVWYECPCRDCEKSLKEAKSQLLQLVLDEVKKMKNTKTGSIEKIIGYDCVSWADGYCQALDDFSQRAREILT